MSLFMTKAYLETQGLTHICAHTHTHSKADPCVIVLKGQQPAGKGYMILSWRRSYLESITVQAPQPPSPQPSFVPLSPTGWSRVKEYELREKKKSLLGCWEMPGLSFE